MSFDMGLYTAEPEPADPRRHEVEAEWYERLPVELEAIAPIDDGSYRLEMSAEFAPRGDRVLVTWLALLTPAGQLVWKKRLPDGGTTLDRAFFTFNYGLDVTIEDPVLA